MACIDRIYSVSALVGGAACNANCASCAGVVWRTSAKQTGNHTSAPRNIVAASRLALSHGAWTLSLTSSGEPTLYPTAITDTLTTLRENNVCWPFINLFSNGIRIAEEWEHMAPLLRMWQPLGLTSVVVSIHSVDAKANSKAYGVDCVLNTKKIIDRVKSVGLCAKVVLLLSRENVGSLVEYRKSLDILRDYGVGLVTSWELRSNSGKRIAQTPSRWEMLKIRAWLATQTTAVMGHVWGGSVHAYRGMNVRLTDYVSPHRPWNNYLRQLVILPDGRVSYSWHQPGMICLD